SKLAECRSVTYDQKDALAECRNVWAEKRRQFLDQSPAGGRPEMGSSLFVAPRDENRRAAGMAPTLKTEREGAIGGSGSSCQFLETFTRYIDSGFGLLGGEVGYLATTLAAIDITLAGLFWAWAADDDILARLVKKTLFVGVFAFLIGNWNNLARIIFESFAGL